MTSNEGFGEKLGWDVWWKGILPSASLLKWGLGGVGKMFGNRGGYPPPPPHTHTLIKENPTLHTAICVHTGYNNKYHNHKYI